MARYDRGILFVHGIGDQQRAETLLQCVDPLIRWLQRWLMRTGPNGKPVGSVTVRRALVSANKAGTPAHVVLDITVNDARGKPCTQQWLLAEGRWAEEARTPPFGRLAAWMLTTGAWIVLSYGLNSARKIMGAKHGGVASIIAFLKAAQAIVLAFALTAVLQFVLAVLLILAVIPIPRFHAALSEVLLKTSGILGDVYVLLESSVQREAIVGSLRRSLKWVARQCERAAVVAHSQGAAVSHRVLRDPNPQNVSAFISYGSGLAKLEELEVMIAAHPDMLQYAKYAVPLAILAAMFVLRIALVYSDRLWALRALWWCLIPATMVLLLFVFAWGKHKTLLQHGKALSLTATRPGLRWTDLYATADMVANEALTLGGVPVEGVEGRLIANRRSVLSDHTTYWENETGFVPEVLRSLDRVFEAGLFDAPAQERLIRAAARRGKRLRWLLVVRWSAIAAAALLVFGALDALTRIGRVVLQALQVQPLTPVGAFALAAGRVPVRLLEWARGDTAGALTSFGYGVAGTIVIVLGVGLAYRIFFAGWRWWEQLYVRELFEPITTDPHDRGVWHWAKLSRATVSGIGVVAIGLVPLIAGVALNAKPVIERWLNRPVDVTELLAYQLLGLMFVALYWVLVTTAAKTIVFDLRSSSGTERWASIGSVATMLVTGLWMSGVLTRRTFGAGAAGCMAIGLVVGVQRWFWDQARELGGLGRIGITALPALLTMAGVATFVSRSRIRSAQDLFDVMYLVLGLYALSAGAAWGALLIARRLSSGAATPPAASL